MDLVLRARQFAIDAHNSIQQKRKYSQEPYHYHCERVVNILKKVTEDPNILAAAWLHDVLEDVAPYQSDYSLEKINALFGVHIGKLVCELTDSNKECGNRERRKAIDRERLLHASIAAKTIKLADLIDNFVDILKYDSHFIVVFARETEKLLPCLIAGNESLRQELENLLNLYKKSLNQESSNKTE